MRKILTGTVMLATLSSPATAANITGNELYFFCTETSDVGNRTCLGYIHGVLEGFAAAATLFDGKGVLAPGAKEAYGICPPDGHHVGQARDLVVKFLRDYSEDRNLHAAALVWTAMRQHWPCQGAEG